VRKFLKLNGSLFLFVFTLCGCAVGDIVNLKHPLTGHTVKCGGNTSYGNIPAANETNLKKQRYCIDDFTRQGYRRIQ
jgi:hypothetical protein